MLGDVVELVVGSVVLVDGWVLGVVSFFVS